MPSTYTVPFLINLARCIVRPIFRGIFHSISRVQITGQENIPHEGAYIIAINHVSLFEPPFVISFWPVAPEAIGAVDIWSRPGQSTLARLYGGIQVHRGEYDRNLIDTMLAVLHSGRPLAIAPEGGRSHTPGMRRAHPGIAYVVNKAKVPVLPVGIVGSTDNFLQKALKGKRPLIQMRIGQPLYLPPLTGNGEELRVARQRNADMVMTHIAALLPPEYRGVYANHPTIIGEATS